MLASLAGAAAERIFLDAARTLGYDPRAFDDETAYRSTVHVQIGLFLCGAICATELEACGVRPALVAGHSVGAYAAAFAARAIALEPALRGVELRARTMERLFPQGYGMGVCAGLASQQVRELVVRAQARGAQLYLANVNAETQCVISGADDALDEALQQCASFGARRAERLPVAVPSHCALLAPVAAALHAYYDGARVEAPACTYVSSMTGRVMRSGDEIRDDLCEGVAREVRWIDAARLIGELGVTMVIESVPGRVLTDLFEPSFGARREPMDGRTVRSICALAQRFR